MFESGPHLQTAQPRAAVPHGTARTLRVESRPVSEPFETFVIRGGEVADGLGGPVRRADALVREGRVFLLPPGAPCEARQELSAAGAWVCPGFIDIHGHSDFASLLYPEAASRVASGVTTECVGNCGYGAFPLAGEVLERRRQEYQAAGLSLDWTDAEGYFRQAQAVGCAMNRVVLVGQGNIRGTVLGYGRRKATARQLARMCSILEECLAAGAAGLSSGLAYAPGMWADTDELAALAAVVARHGGLYASHIRNESDELLEATDEFLEILQRSGCRGQFSHIKTAGPRNWHKLSDLAARLSAAKNRGIAVTADRYPYTASATDLGTIVLPRQAVAGSQEQVLARLGDAASRGRIIRQIRRQKGQDLQRWHDAVVITSVGEPSLRPCIGKNLRQVAEFLRAADATEAAIQLIHDDKLLTQAIHFSMSESNLREIYTWDFVAVGSDSSCRSRLSTGEEERPHPRAYGTLARFWELAVRGWGILSPGAAVRRMTSLPAEILGLADRGVLRDGAAADIAVIEPDTFADRATYEDPCRTPAGVRFTIVNGRIVWRDGRHTGERPGQLLRAAGV